MRIVGIYVSYLKFIRATEILWVLFKHSIKELFTHSRLNKRRRRVHKTVYTTPERLRMTIEELGPTFVKFGQILADRPDMVSEKFRVELKKLQSRALPFDNENAMALIEKELNASISSIFSYFDTTPLAAASIGQVYQACLEDGQEVIVKIQRPFIENKIKLDIYLLKYLARKFAKNYPELAAINIVGLIDEFSATIMRELDYTLEASNIVRFEMMFKDSPTVHIPKVYKEYTTKRLIIMEHIHGTTPNSNEQLREAGLDTSVIAVNGANALLTMILRHGFFHADPHPGNIFILENNVVSFIDFGMVGVLTPRDMNFLADFTIGFAHSDSDLISRSLITLCGKKFFDREENLKFEIHQLIQQYKGLPLEMISFSNAMQSCVDIIVKYQLQIPSGIFMLIKALATLEKFATNLDPSISLPPIIMPYAKEVVKSKFSARKLASEMYDTARNYSDFIRNLPNDVSEILYKIKEGKIHHEIALDDEAMFTKVVGQLSRRVAYVIILVGLFIGSTILVVMRPEHSYGTFIMVVSSILIFLQMAKWLFGGK